MRTLMYSVVWNHIIIKFQIASILRSAAEEKQKQTNNQKE